MLRNKFFFYDVLQCLGGVSTILKMERAADKHKTYLRVLCSISLLNKNGGLCFSLCAPFSFTCKKTLKMNNEYYQELNRLKTLCHLPSVQMALEALINEGRQVREPIKRTKVCWYFLDSFSPSYSYL